MISLDKTTKLVITTALIGLCYMWFSLPFDYFSLSLLCLFTLIDLSIDNLISRGFYIFAIGTVVLNVTYQASVTGIIIDPFIAYLLLISTYLFSAIYMFYLVTPDVLLILRALISLYGTYNYYEDVVITHGDIMGRIEALAIGIICTYFVLSVTRPKRVFSKSMVLLRKMYIQHHIMFKNIKNGDRVDTSLLNEMNSIHQTLTYLYKSDIYNLDLSNTQKLSIDNLSNLYEELRHFAVNYNYSLAYNQDNMHQYFTSRITYLSLKLTEAYDLCTSFDLYENIDNL